MIFNEIYSAYYNTVAKIISAVIDGSTDDRTIGRIVSENAFGESVLTVLPALRSGKWQLIHGDMTTPLRHTPTMPLTLIQKKWLKALSLDPRIKLFGVEFPGLEDVDPLFTSDDYFIYDKYSDGDPFEDESYIEHFRTILTAIKTGQNICIEMLNRKGNTVYTRCRPERLEYSEKDDKFRLIGNSSVHGITVNIARITKCKIYYGDDVIDSGAPEPRYETVILRVSEERNTLERCLMHFAHFEKRATRVGDHYLLHIKFLKDDEAELVIRVLSFGPTVEVLEPEGFKNLIIAKLKSQKSCDLR